MRTVKLRIAVVVLADGSWGAFGSNRHTDSDLLCYASDIADDTGELPEPPRNICFVEAEVPLPEPASVRGKVVGGD